MASFVLVHRFCASSLRWVALLLVLFSAVLLAPRASAQSVTERAAAEALFDEGRKFMDAGNFAEACSKFEKSQNIDPAVGTLLNLAECLHKLGKFASAWTRYKEAGNLAALRQDPRAGVAAERAHALEPQLSRLTLNVSEGSAITGLEVRRGEQRIDAALFGTALPIDAGPHEITATAPGHKAWTHTVEIVVGQTLALEIPRLEAEPTAAASPEPKKPPPAAKPQKPPPPSAPLSTESAESGNTWGWVIGSTGVVLMGVGSVLALNAKGKYDDAESRCTDGQRGCDAKAASLSKEAVNQGNIASVVGGVGLVGLVVGGIILLSGTDSESAQTQASPAGIALTPVVQPGLAGLLLEGRLP